MRRVVVTGLGIVSAAGRGVAATQAALRAGRSGLGPLTRFASPRCGHFPVAEVRDVAGEPRTVALGREALAQALAQARLADASSAGLAVGTCVAGMVETEAALGREFRGEAIDGTVFARHECGATTDALARGAGLRGPCTTVSTACSSSALAIATAADWIRAGVAPVVVAGGTDALCRLTLNGFASLLNVAPQGCAPFDVARQGMSLGEGAAFLVLEDAAHAAARGAAVLAVLAGHGNSCDAHHPTAPHPDGLGAEAAMAGALRMAGLRPADVDYVNAHGTGTVENDRAEGRALRRLFGAAVPLVSSTKGVFGHTLGAAGAVEAVVCVLALRGGFLPGTVGLREPDPACEVEPLRACVDAAPRVVLSNSFGFGGNNSALCFTAAEGA